MSDWMIYGATGFTGVLVAEEAVRRGHKPLLAGRSEAKLKPLAERLGLEYVAFQLDDTAALEKAVSRVELVYHAAGPFTNTVKPVVEACLKYGAHYLDINGELPLYQYVFSFDQAAREKKIALLPGIGFDVLPSDCLVSYVADQLPDATHLDVAVDILGGGSGISAGTAKSSLDLIASTGDLVRRDGRLIPHRFGAGGRKFHFVGGEKTALPMTWGDLEMGYRSTNIPNITAYMTFPPLTALAVQLTGWVLPFILKPKVVRDAFGWIIDRIMLGPSESTRETGRSHVYAAVSNAKGEKREAWLETAEAYQFTALCAVRVVERVLDGNYSGAITPSKAFGADFVLEIEGSKRFDTLP